jgi:hypothetical protein
MLDKKTPLKAHNHSKNTLCQTLTAGTGRPDAPYRGGELVVLDALVFLDYQPGDVVILGRARRRRPSALYASPTRRIRSLRSSRDGLTDRLVWKGRVLPHRFFTALR